MSCCDSGKEFEIVVVDDGSPDGTQDVVRRLQREYGDHRIVRRASSLGAQSQMLRWLCRCMPTASGESWVHRTASLCVRQYSLAVGMPSHIWTAISFPWQLAQGARQMWDSARALARVNDVVRCAKRSLCVYVSVCVYPAVELWRPPCELSPSVQQNCYFDLCMNQRMLERAPVRLGLDTA